MRRFALALLFCAAFCVASVWPATALNRNAFAFTRYELDAVVDPHQHGLSVAGTVELRNVSQQPQREASLQVSSSLRWLSVVDVTANANGEELEWLAQPLASDIDHTGSLSEAIVKFEQPVAPGASVRLRLRYSGVVRKDATRLDRIGTPESASQRSDWDEISDNFTALRGVGYVAWYPVAMEPASLSSGNELFDTLSQWRERESGGVLRVHLARTPLPEGDSSTYAFVVNGVGSMAAAGAANGSAPETAESVTAEFHAGDEPVVVLMESPGSTTDRPHVAGHYTVAHTSTARDYMSAAEAVIPALEEWFGPPRRKAVIVELTDPNALPFNTGNYYYVPLRPVLPAAAEVALARMVAHTMIDSPRPWIREGLATFAQALVRERQGGHGASLEYLGQFVSALRIAEAESHGLLPKDAGAAKDSAARAASEDSVKIAPQPLVTTSDELFYRTKAAYVWWMLRDMVGQQTLQQALAHYRAEDDRNPAYIQQLIQKYDPVHHDLETFFDDWVYRDRGLPEFHVESAYVRKTLEEQTVTAITVENLSEVWCEVPVLVRSSEGENQARVVVPPKGKATVRIPFATTPAEAEVNDGSIPEATPRERNVAVTVVSPTPLPEPPPPPAPIPVNPVPVTPRGR